MQYPHSDNAPEAFWLNFSHFPLLCASHDAAEWIARGTEKALLHLERDMLIPCFIPALSCKKLSKSCSIVQYIMILFCPYCSKALQAGGKSSFASAVPGKRLQR